MAAWVRNGGFRVQGSTSLGVEAMEFITAQERQQIEGKLDDLKAKRPVLSKRIAEARALGDLHRSGS